LFVSRGRYLIIESHSQVAGDEEDEERGEVCSGSGRELVMVNKSTIFCGGGGPGSSLKFRGGGRCLGGGEIDQPNLDSKKQKEGEKVN